jgi:hypothetical protein
MKTQHALGKLKITKTENITEATHHNIWLALRKHSFYSIVEPNLWEIGNLKVSSQRYVKDGKLAATEFINKLAAILIEEGIPELGLNGEITLITTDDETSESTVVYRLLVKNNTVLYAKADLKWDDYKEAQILLPIRDKDQQ